MTKDEIIHEMDSLDRMNIYKYLSDTSLIIELLRLIIRILADRR